jgi:hypothetical protein
MRCVIVTFAKCWHTPTFVRVAAAGVGSELQMQRCSPAHLSPHAAGARSRATTGRPPSPPVASRCSRCSRCPPRSGRRRRQRASPGDAAAAPPSLHPRRHCQLMLTQPRRPQLQRRQSCVRAGDHVARCPYRASPKMNAWSKCLIKCCWHSQSTAAAHVLLQGGGHQGPWRGCRGQAQPDHADDAQPVWRPGKRHLTAAQGAAKP